MANCSFCGKPIGTGTGFVVFKKTGQALNYCSRKCRRNFELGRNPRKVRWIARPEK